MLTRAQLRSILNELVSEELEKRNSSILTEGRFRNFLSRAFPVVGRILGRIDAEYIISERNSNLLFDGDHLHWRHGDKTVIKWRAQAGITPFNEPGTPEAWKSWLRIGPKTEDFMQMKNMGPSPEGTYDISRMQSRDEKNVQRFRYKIKALLDFVSGNSTNHNWKSGTASDYVSWGNHRISMTQRTGRTYGRGSMYIHGGSVRGSHGCIDLRSQMDQFAVLFTMWQAKTGRRTMKLHVEYNVESLSDVADWFKDKFASR